MREDTRAVRSHSWFLGVACVIALSVILAMSAITVLPDRTAAGDGLKIVRGNVWDDSWNAVPGADVTVNIMYASTTSIRATQVDVTNETGVYSVTFGMTDWDVGDTIETTASIASYQNSNTTTATSSNIEPIQYVNVTLTGYVIPEFGSGTVLAIVGTTGIMLAIAFSSARRRR